MISVEQIVNDDFVKGVASQLPAGWVVTAFLEEELRAVRFNLAKVGGKNLDVLIPCREIQQAWYPVEFVSITLSKHLVKAKP